MPRALVIDDQPFVRATVSLILRGHGFDVTEAEGGKAGLKKLEEMAFDVAIVDIYMPEMDGVQVIKFIREREPKLPVIAMSGVELNSSERMALDYFAMKPELEDIPTIKKPFKPNELMGLVQRTMARNDQ